VPAKPDGVDKQYSDWLWYYDPDIIYSFVALEEEAVAHIHERYSPTYLKIDGSITSQEGGIDLRQLELPLKGLGSLSLVTALLSRRNLLSGKISDLKIIDKYYDRNESQFIEENFGFVSTSYRMNLSRLYPELFGSLSLISEESLANQYMGKDPAAQYVKSEIELLEEFAKANSIWSVAAASDFLAPYLGLSYNEWSEGVSLVVGDSIDDRLLFWNQHHWRDEVWQGEIAGLRITPTKFEDESFVSVLKKLLLRRAKRSSGHLTITLRSCSLSAEELSLLAEKLKAEGFWPGVFVKTYADHGVCVPKFQAHHHEPSYRYSHQYSGIRAYESSEFSGNKAYVPVVLPWHMREALPPQELRHGCWITALEVSRSNDNSRFSNVRESWVFPRRLHLEKAVKIS
jgi:hypothetical protein